MLMQNRAPGLNRGFAAEQFPQLGSELWREERDAARAAIHPTDFRARGTDIDPDCVRVAKESAVRAGVAAICDFSVMDARNISNPDGVRGTIVTNPPYGERLMTMDEANRLYAAIGRAFTALAPWQVYILSSDADFERHYGKRADKVRKLYNGMIPCNLYQFFKADKPAADRRPPRAPYPKREWR